MQSLRKELATRQELPSEGSEKTGRGMPETARCHFCHIIFIGSKSLGPAHTQRWGVTQKHGRQEADPQSHCSNDCLHLPWRPVLPSTHGASSQDGPPPHRPEPRSLIAGSSPSSLCSSVTSSGMLSLTLNPSCSLFFLPPLLFSLTLGNFEQTPAQAVGPPPLEHKLLKGRGFCLFGSLL